MGNPFHLNDEICKMLKVCGCEKYQMSLDGMRETHDWFRKPGSFDLTIEKIGCLNRAGIKSVIMSTVSKTNMDEIPDIIDEVVKAKAKVFAFSRYVPTGGEVDTSMTPEEYRKLLEVCDAKYKAYEKAGCETYFNKKDHLWTLYEYETGQFKLPESKDGKTIYTTDVIVEEHEFAQNKDGSGGEDLSETSKTDKDGFMEVQDGEIPFD